MNTERPCYYCSTPAPPRDAWGKMHACRKCIRSERLQEEAGRAAKRLGDILLAPFEHEDRFYEERDRLNTALRKLKELDPDPRSIDQHNLDFYVFSLPNQMRRMAAISNNEIPEDGDGEEF